MWVYLSETTVFSMTPEGDPELPDDGLPDESDDE